MIARDLITRDIGAFLRQARALEAFAPACPKAVFLVAPEGFSLAAESASDNLYMDMARAIDGERALRQHRGLQRSLAESLPAICFAGDPATPDAVFPNNVFATAKGRVLIARMRHPVRQREAERADILGFFTDALGYELHDLRTQAGVGELTGSLVIDR
ncbi:MAG TPA: arginine deiminase-related protein, partial [Xanthomonadaceae bacterium]|nr:arginine deiminase-related protein [Xanthomonadaceae bacterium]